MPERRNDTKKVSVAEEGRNDGFLFFSSSARVVVVRITDNIDALLVCCVFQQLHPFYIGKGPLMKRYLSK